jgi:hypothetical protein
MILRQRRLLEDQANIIRDLRRQLEAAGCGFVDTGGGGIGGIGGGTMPADVLGLNDAPVEALEADALAKVCHLYLGFLWDTFAYFRVLYTKVIEEIQYIH